MLRSTIQLLRFPFSFFLMPVYWFALAMSPSIDVTNAVSIFVILHLFVYPSSNGYNSYMDRDTGSIGGIEKPMAPTKQLLYASILMDCIAITASLFIGIVFTCGIILYISASRAYSYRGIRLKRYPVAGYFTVIIFQGALVFLITIAGVSVYTSANVVGMIAAALLVGGFYPLTQVYQHQQDKDDGVITISALLGYKGTFLFSGSVFTLALTVIAFLFWRLNLLQHFTVFLVFFTPVLFYFCYWAAKVFKNNNEADFRNTMRMNFIASACTNAAFIYLLIRSH